MTDNAMVYRNSRRFAAVLASRGVRHILTPPYTPRWNGKAERFIQTLQAGVGLCPSVAELDRAPTFAAILHALLQPTSTAQLLG